MSRRNYVLRNEHKHGPTFPQQIYEIKDLRVFLADNRDLMGLLPGTAVCATISLPRVLNIAGVEMAEWLTKITGISKWENVRVGGDNSPYHAFVVHACGDEVEASLLFAELVEKGAQPIDYNPINGKLKKFTLDLEDNV